MKKLSKNLALFLVVSSILIPILPTIAQDEEEEVPPYRLATFSTVGDWDGPINPGWSLLSLYFASACLQEPIQGGLYDYEGGTGDVPLHEEWADGLCTDWEIEYWPSEQNNLGWNNTGGVKSIEWTLREDVNFHDGSSWNATVMKWNFDRYYLITGNLTGNGDMREFDYWFPEVAKTESYWTPGWNLSAFDDQVAGYYVGPGVDYPGVNEIDGWVNNPNPYGGLDSAGDAIYYAPYDRFPLLKYVEITESKESGGKVKVHWNSWNSYSGEGNFVEMISYAAYAEHYTGRGIYGYQNDVKDYRNPTQVDHMIGTGTYKYVEDADQDGGYLVVNKDYWNYTDMRAEGFFDIERLEFVNFPSSSAGGLAMNNALLSHSVDGAITGGSGVTGQMDIGAIKANPNINYWPSAPNEYLEQITLNSINETYWAWPWVIDEIISVDYPNEEGKINGQPQALRKALSFAYDYDYLIDVALEGNAVRQGGLVGKANLYYNSSVPIAEFNLNYAREILLTTEEDTSGKVFTDYNAAQGYIPNPDLYNFSKRCAERGLTASSTNAEWQAVAESSDPVWEIDYYWDQDMADIKDEFQRACYRLGVALKDPVGLTNRLPQPMWNVIQTYWETAFPTGSSIFSSGAFSMYFQIEPTTPEAWIDYSYRDPSNGKWRTDGADGIANDKWPRWNYGFGYDDRMNNLLDRMWMSSPDLKKNFFNQMAELQQTELYPYIYTIQGVGGNAIWDCWEVELYNQTRTGIVTGVYGFPGGMYMYAIIKYKGCPERTPAIPGYPPLMTLTVAMISILGVSYIVIKRNKLR